MQTYSAILEAINSLKSKNIEAAMPTAEAIASGNYSDVIKHEMQILQSANLKDAGAIKPAILLDHQNIPVGQISQNTNTPENGGTIAATSTKVDTSAKDKADAEKLEKQKRYKHIAFIAVAVLSVIVLIRIFK